MDTPLPSVDHTDNSTSETSTDRLARLAREAAAIAEADADIAAGRLISEAAMDEWIDSIGTAHEKPPPRSGS